MRALSRYDPARHYVADGLVLHHAGDVEAGFSSAQYHFIIDFNPLAQFLELLRNPFLGEPISGHAWIITTAIALGGGC